MFQKLYEIASKGVDLNMVVSAPVEGKLTVSILPKARDEKTELKLKPLVISGTPDELAAGFLDELEKAGKATAGLMSNITEYQRAAASADVSGKKDAEKSVVKSPVKAKAKAVSAKPDGGEEKPASPTQDEMFDDL